MKVALNTNGLMNNIATQLKGELLMNSKTLVINLMSSPEEGKTTLLEETVKALSHKYRIGVIKGDLATEKDVERIRQHGAKAVQMNTYGGCHLDARMIAATLPEFDLDDLDILFIENVRNYRMKEIEK